MTRSTPLFSALLLTLVSFAFAVPAASVYADTPTETIEADGGDGSSDETVFTLIMKGGWLMVPIGFCSIVILMFALERVFSLRRGRTFPHDLLENTFELLPADAVTADQAKRVATEVDQTSSIAGNVISGALRKLHLGRDATSHTLEELGAREAMLLKRRLRPFGVVETLAPLLGLLGTVYGMITCFENAASTDAASRSESLARGIYAALVTTAAGLSVAIPAKVLYHYFESKVDRLLDQLEEHADTFLEFYFDSNVAQAAASATNSKSAPATAPGASRKELIAKTLKGGEATS